MFELLREFIDDKRVASVARTRADVVEKICESIDFRDKKVIVEFGPGDGAFTEVLLCKMDADARLVCFETNHHLRGILGARISDPRILVLGTDACDFKQELSQLGISAVDLLLTGIPFTFLSPKRRQRLLNDVASMLGERGIFVAYQSLTAPLTMTALRKVLLRKYEIKSTTYHLDNIPPLYCFAAQPSLVQQGGVGRRRT